MEGESVPVTEAPKDTSEKKTESMAEEEEVDYAQGDSEDEARDKSAATAIRNSMFGNADLQNAGQNLSPQQAEKLTKQTQKLQLLQPAEEPQVMEEAGAAAPNPSPTLAPSTEEFQAALRAADAQHTGKAPERSVPEEPIIIGGPELMDEYL